MFFFVCGPCDSRNRSLASLVGLGIPPLILSHVMPSVAAIFQTKLEATTTMKATNSWLCRVSAANLKLAFLELVNLQMHFVLVCLRVMMVIMVN